MDIESSRRALEEKLRELTSRVDQIKDDLRQPADADWAENATESENDEVLEEIGGVSREEIRQIKLALTQIEAGTYGTCMRCGEPIAEERLEAIPHATRCVKCA